MNNNNSQNKKKQPSQQSLYARRAQQQPRLINEHSQLVALIKELKNDRLGKQQPIRTQTLNAAQGYSAVNRSSFQKYRVQHRELVVPQVSVGSDDYTGVFQCNAASKTLFPWLSQIAPSFERFKVESMSLQYRPVCGTTT